MLVLCNFCQHTPLLTHLGDIIKRAVQYHRSMRVCFMICLLYETHSLKLADPGKIVQTGLSAGSQSWPSIAWVQNFLSKGLLDNAIAKLDWETAHVFSLFWMLIHWRLPSIVSDDLIDWMAKTGIQHMNKDVLQDFQKETYLERLSWILGMIYSIFNGQNLLYLLEWWLQIISGIFILLFLLFL